jgi:alpha/beta superfamily hydrolase
MVYFRGVGNSKGSGSWRGTAERKDVLAACNFLLNYRFETDKDESNENNRVNKVLLVGYSYGSGIASSVVNELDSIIGYVAISYPFGPFFFLYFGNNALQQQADSKKPKLFIMGANDDFTSLDTLQSKFNGFSEPKEMIVVDKVDHFWFGREEGLCLRIFEWLKSTFPFIAQNFPLPST